MSLVWRSSHWAGSLTSQALGFLFNMPCICYQFATTMLCNKLALNLFSSTFSQSAGRDRQVLCCWALPSPSSFLIKGFYLNFFHPIIYLLGSVHYGGMWRSERNLRKLVLLFHHVYSGDGTVTGGFWVSTLLLGQAPAPYWWILGKYSTINLYPHPLSNFKCWNRVLLSYPGWSWILSFILQVGLEPGIPLPQAPSSWNERP